MRCPHCSTGIHFEGIKQVSRAEEASATGLGFEVIQGFCPVCHKLIVLLRTGEYRWIEDQGEIINVKDEQLLYPKFQSRFLSSNIPEKYQKLFEEANAVLGSSPRASAALSRRILQHLLREEFKIQLGDQATLDAELREFIKLSNVPSNIKDVVDEVRHIGNWAAHPIKYKNTGEIVDVEPKEAEWMLDILEDILDLLFVQPKLEQQRLAKYDQKRREIRR